MITTRLTQRVSLVEQELRTLPEHLSSPPVFSGVRVTRSLVLYVCLLIVVCSFVLFLLAIVFQNTHILERLYHFSYINILKSLEDLIILI